jgi:hypothetical protein
MGSRSGASAGSEARMCGNGADGTKVAEDASPSYQVIRNGLMYFEINLELPRQHFLQ